MKTALPSLKLAPPKTITNYHVDRVGKVSSRPWAELAGQPATPSFVDQREYVGQPNFNLLWIGKTPR